MTKRDGSSTRHRATWKAMYAKTPYDRLPWFEPGPSSQVIHAVAEKFLPPKAVILDVGCGAGSNVLYLAREGFESHGIDLSPDAIQAAKSRVQEAGVKADLQVGDALALNFSRGRFGAVTDNGCFHTLPVRRRPEYAQEIARVLRPGGAFLLAWIAREHTADWGPPHRPSLDEVTNAFEAQFLFARTEFHPPKGKRTLAFYDAWLTRRTTPQPAPR